MKDKLKKYEKPVLIITEIDFKQSIAVSGQGAGLWEEFDWE